MTEEFLRGHRKFHREYVADERDFLERLASEGQSPDALYIGCSDSRVVPELLTSSSPGALFVLRNVANLVPTFDDPDSSVGAAIEYAIGHLHVPHIIVCGHYGCGGVKAALDGLDKIRELPSLFEWLSEVRTAAENLDPALESDLRWRRAVEESVVFQLGNLPSYPAVAHALAAGTLRLHGWVYDIHTCALSVYDVDRHAFIPSSAFFP
jgi:carbonic anhydrase